MDSILENELAWVRYDKHPVSPGHLPIINNNYIMDFLDVTIDRRTSGLEKPAGRSKKYID